MNRIKYDEYEKGAEIPELQVGPLKHMDLVRYAGASGDFNPIHTDPEFAVKEAGLDSTIAHGMYVMAQLGRLATNWVHPGQMKSFGVKFKGMTFPGDVIVCKGKVKKKNDDAKEMTVSLEAQVNGETKVAGDLVVACD